MYKPFEGGSKEKVNGLVCHIPPIGYGYDYETHKLVEVETIKRSKDPKEQYWERVKDPVPDWYKKGRKQEERIQEKDPDYFDPDLENFREREWKRRLYGIWVYIKGNPTYLPGLFYFWLTYWQLDVGKPVYRDTDRRFYYFLQYCIEDPNCYGMVMVTKRRQGKTAKGGVFLTEAVTRTKNVNAGLQSKTEKDAKKVVFANAIVRPFKYLPHYFRPVYDTSQGITPKSELRFYRTNKRGKLSLTEELEEELESLMDYRASGESSYDGDKLYRYLGDEIFKSEGVDIVERHRVNKLCMLDENGMIGGKMLYTSTVEEIEGEIEKYKEFWYRSDPTKPEKNGQTKTGLYKYFVSALETMFFDKYGFPDREKAREHYQAIRDSLADDPAALVAERRRNPFEEKEAFFLTSKECHFDAGAIEERLDILDGKKNLYDLCKLDWNDPKKKDFVIAKPARNGHFKIIEYPENPNNFQMINGFKKPLNNTRYASGIDPYDKLFTVSDRLSQGACYVKRKYDPTIPPEKSNKYVVEYIYRPQTPKILYEDILKLCVYYGCSILVEDNKDGIIQYFYEQGFGNYLMWLPGAKKPGISAAQTKDFKAYLVEVMDEYITYNIDKMFFKEQLKDLRRFNVEKTREFDAAMAAIYTEIASLNKMHRRQETKVVDVKRYFRKFKSA